VHADRLFDAALGLSSINLFVFCSYEFYFANLFLKVSSDRLRIISAGNISASDNETAMVQVAVNKVFFFKKK